MFVGVPISALRTDCYKTPIGLKDWLVRFPYRIMPVAIASVLTLSSCTDRQYDLLTGPERLGSDEQVPAQTGTCLVPNPGIYLESGVTELLICGVTVSIGPYAPGTVFGEFPRRPEPLAARRGTSPTVEQRVGYHRPPCTCRRGGEPSLGCLYSDPRVGSKSSLEMATARPCCATPPIGCWVCTTSTADGGNLRGST